MYESRVRTMKNVKEYLKKYLTYSILFLIIFILFLFTSYENLNGYNNTVVSYNNKNNNLINECFLNQDKLYFSYEDLKKFFNEDVYIDKLSRKIIITTKNIIKKSELNSQDSYTNFERNDTISINYTKHNDIDYILVDSIAQMYNLEVVYNEQLNMIWLIENDIEKVNLSYDRCYGYLEENCKSKRVLLTNSNEIYVVKDNRYYDVNDEYFTTLVKKDSSEFVVHVKKNDLVVTIDEQKDLDIEKTEFLNIFVNEENLDFSNGTNGIILSGFRLLNKSGDILNTYNKDLINKAKDQQMKCFVTLTNGYKMSNYDNSISATVLQGEQTREKVIKQIAEVLIANNIDGVVVDFREIHQNSKDNFSQFIKELAAYLHSKDKKVLVYIPNDATFIDLEIINTYADYGILVQYGTKTQTSKTSGTHSSVKWIDSNLNGLKNYEYDMNKFILEIPLYSIMWTEKNNKVVDSDIYYYSALDGFISTNGLTPIIDETASQRYIEYIKGSLKYKMWLEDEYSIKQKIDLASLYELGGISLYKKGYDTANLLEKIK